MEEKSNFFTSLMAKKTDQELLAIIQDINGYDSDARLAASRELEKRGVAAESDAASAQALPALTLAGSKQPTGEALALEDEHQGSIAQDEPLLYSPRSIYGFSVFFSPVFGAVLLYSNLKALDKPKEARITLLFGVVYTVFVVVLLNNFLPQSTGATVALNVAGALMLKEFFWNRDVGKELHFQKKSIIKPLIISFIIIIPFILAIIYA